MKELPVEEVVHKVEDTTCDNCGSEMTVVGKEFVRDEVVYVPAKMICRKHYIEIMKCTKCHPEENQDDTKSDTPYVILKKAEAPEAFIPHSFCSPELLAHIIFQKYVLGTSENRVNKRKKPPEMATSRK